MDEINEDLFPHLDKIPRLRTAIFELLDLAEWQDPEPVECETGTVDPPDFIVPNKVALDGVYKIFVRELASQISSMFWRMKSVATNRINAFYTPALLEDMENFLHRLEKLNIEDYIGLLDINTRNTDEHIKDYRNITLLFRDRMENPFTMKNERHWHEEGYRK